MAWPFFRTRSDSPGVGEEIADLREQLAALREELALTDASYALGTSLDEARSTYDISPTDARVRASLMGTVSGHVRDEAKLYDMYRNVPWINSAFNVIARRMISGSWRVESEAGNTATVAAVESLFRRCSATENMNKLVYQTVISLLIFGRAYWEMVTAAGQPQELYFVNALTMQENVDAKGQISGYLQVMPDGTKQSLRQEQIIRFAVCGPLGEITSPLMMLLPTATLWNFMNRWATQFFRHGGKHDRQIVLPEGTQREQAERFQAFWQENFAGVSNAYKDPILFGGAEIKSLGYQGMIEMDFLKTRDTLRDEFLAVVGVPPAMVGQIESGNLGGGTGESQDRTLENNTVKPLRELIEEQVNYRILQQGFGLTEGQASFILPGASYRGQGEEITEIMNLVNTGLVTRQTAAEMLELPEDLGDGATIPTVTLQREIVPLSDFTQIHGSQWVAAQSSAINTGLDPGATPSDLASASPRDPSTPGPDHPVQRRDDQFQAAQSRPDQPEDPGGARGEAAQGDLVRWQRLALKAVREGREHRLFTSEAIDPVTYFALVTSLPHAETEDEVRELFDLAFADVRAS